jgi:hypothetical protein
MYNISNFDSFTDFLPMANLSAASTENTTAVLTCRCHSNPPCQIISLTFSYHRPDIFVYKKYPCAPVSSVPLA